MAKIYEFLLKIIELFPDDPLAAAVAKIQPLEVLGYLNYFLPISEMALLTKAWVGAVLAAKVAGFLYNIFIKKV